MPPPPPLIFFKYDFLLQYDISKVTYDIEYCIEKA